MNRRQIIKAGTAAFTTAFAAPAAFGSEKRSQSKNIATEIINKVDKYPETTTHFSEYYKKNHKDIVTLASNNGTHYLQTANLFNCLRFDPELGLHFPADSISLEVLDYAAKIVADHYGCRECFTPTYPIDKLTEKTYSVSYLCTDVFDKKCEMTLHFTLITNKGSAIGTIPTNYFLDKHAAFPLDFFIGTAKQAYEVGRVLRSSYGYRNARIIVA